MSQYTTTMWELKKSENLKNKDLFPEYSFYDKDRLDNFEELFYGEYFDREIGFETYSLFKAKLKHKLNLIMPKYQMIYDTKSLIIDPMMEFDFTETYDKDKVETMRSKGESADTSTAQGSQSTEGSNTANSLTSDENIHSDTPQGYLTESDLKDHATDVTASKVDNESVQANLSSGSSEQSGNTSGTSKTDSDRDENEVYTRNIKGNRTKSQAELLNAYRDLWYNIDKMIIDECSDLFMGVF